MAEIEAVILAGGRSRRMGRDKALLPFGGYSTLAEYQYRRVLSHFERVSLSAKEWKFPFEAPWIRDEGAEHSPMIALASILGSVGSEWVFVLGVDMPFVGEGVISRLREEMDLCGEKEIIVSESPRGIEPLCGIYRRRILPRVEEELAWGRHRIQGLFGPGRVQRVRFDDASLFENLNHPHEYERARSGFGGNGS